MKNLRNFGDKDWYGSDGKAFLSVSNIGNFFVNVIVAGEKEIEMYPDDFALFLHRYGDQLPWDWNRSFWGVKIKLTKRKQ